MYIRKTTDEFEIQGNYGDTYGFEMVATEDNWKQAKQTIKEYRENEIGISFRIVKKRVKKETK